jgi:anti-sigma factor RsiW
VHVTDEEIRRLVSGRLERVERLRVFRHLFSACPVCSRKWAPYLDLLEGGEAGELPDSEAVAYDQVLDRTFDGAVRQAARLAEDRAWHDRFVAEVRAREIVGFNAIVDTMDWEMPAAPRSRPC